MFTVILNSLHLQQALILRTSVALIRVSVARGPRLLFLRGHHRQGWLSAGLSKSVKSPDPRSSAIRSCSEAADQISKPSSTDE